MSSASSSQNRDHGYLASHIQYCACANLPKVGAKIFGGWDTDRFRMAAGMLAFYHRMIAERHVMAYVGLHNHTGKPRITHRILCYELKTINNWDKIVQMIDVEDCLLEAIEKNNHAIEDQRREAFRLWLNNKPNLAVSWDPIIVALRKVGEMTLAAKLERKYQWKEPRVRL